MTTTTNPDMTEREATLARQVRVLRDALAFYADSNNYDSDGTCWIRYDGASLYGMAEQLGKPDSGQTARLALKRTSAKPVAA